MLEALETLKPWKVNYRSCHVILHTHAHSLTLGHFFVHSYTHTLSCTHTHTHTHFLDRNQVMTSGDLTFSIEEELRFATQYEEGYDLYDEKYEA